MQREQLMEGHQPCSQPNWSFVAMKSWPPSQISPSRSFEIKIPNQNPLLFPKYRMKRSKACSQSTHPWTLTMIALLKLCTSPKTHHALQSYQTHPCWSTKYLNSNLKFGSQLSTPSPSAIIISAWPLKDLSKPPSSCKWKYAATRVSSCPLQTRRSLFPTLNSPESQVEKPDKHFHRIIPAVTSV